MAQGTLAYIIKNRGIEFTSRSTGEQKELEDLLKKVDLQLSVVGDISARRNGSSIEITPTIDERMGVRSAVYKGMYDAKDYHNEEFRKTALNETGVEIENLIQISRFYYDRTDDVLTCYLDKESKPGEIDSLRIYLEKPKLRG